MLTRSEGIFAGKHVDRFRIDDGLIVEHWDCIHEIATERKNPNRPF